MEKISPEDVNETLKLLKDIPMLATSVSDSAQSLLKKFKNDELQTKNGLSLFDLKNHTLLNYIADLSYLILQKTSGKTIENNSAIERLCESRIVLEKMRPIEEKLRYQVDKLLVVASTGHIDVKDPLRFKANPENLEDQGENEDSDDEHTNSNVYVPPKISAAYFNENETLEEKKQKVFEKSKKRALSSSVLYELRKEYDTGPEEIKETVDPHKIKFNEEMKDRTRYEEEYMMRLPMTKRQRHEASQLMTVTNFNPKFDDVTSFDIQPEEMSMKKKSFGKKGKKFKNSKKWKGKKRKH